MSRWVRFFLCILLGIGMILLGWLVPVHLRAVDSRLLQRAGKNTPSLVDSGITLIGERRLGAAQMIWEAAQSAALPDRQALGNAVTNAIIQHPSWLIWGGGESHLDMLFATDPKLPKRASEPFTEWVVRLDNRGTALRLLNASSRPTVHELLKCRALTNTTLFPPSQSASGQAFDAALSICALLAEESRFSAGLSNAVYNFAAQANRGESTQPLEELFMDLMSLGQRFNWGQLVVFVGRIDDAETLRRLGTLVRSTEARVPLIFAAVQFSGQPSAVAGYLMKFSQSGLDDIRASLRFRKGGLNELLRGDKRLYASKVEAEASRLGLLKPFFDFALDWSLQTPKLAFTLKWGLYLFGGFLLAIGVHFVRPAVSALERPLQVRGFHVARELLFALGFLLVVLLLSEPFLSQESQKVDFPFRSRLPMAGAAVPPAVAGAKSLYMNQLSLLTLLLFFVLQALIYVACLVKLAEIRRQQIPPRLKLKLLENEDHLFDAGLYLGFAGTIVSLILVSLGVIKPSLMAAYSSTSFGIIFVSVFKIFHLRPARRQLLLISEADSEGSGGSLATRAVHSTP
jgi:hypothetical protein